MGILDTLEVMRERYGSPPVSNVSAPPVEDHSFVLENVEKSRLVVSTPLQEFASSEKARASSPGLMLQGRLVGAEVANRNGAFWTKGDLEFGLPSVSNSPLNWVHRQEEIVGCLYSPYLEQGEWSNDRYATVSDAPFFIETRAVMWDWIYPERGEILRQALSEDKAWLSMECVGEAMQCQTCDSFFNWDEAMSLGERVCEHIRERSGVRRIVNPTFLGAAVIVPPVEPGWSAANLKESHWANEYAAAEKAFAGLAERDAIGILSQIAAWSSR